MVNLLGATHAPLNIYGRDKLLEIEGCYLHIYGKDSCKPERKMGHITVLDKDLSKAYDKAKLAGDLIKLHLHDK